MSFGISSDQASGVRLHIYTTSSSGFWLGRRCFLFSVKGRSLQCQRCVLTEESCFWAKQHLLLDIQHTGMFGIVYIRIWGYRGNYIFQLMLSGTPFFSFSSLFHSFLSSHFFPLSLLLFSFPFLSASLHFLLFFLPSRFHRLPYITVIGGIKRFRMWCFRNRNTASSHHPVQPPTRVDRNIFTFH